MFNANRYLNLNTKCDHKDKNDCSCGSIRKAKSDDLRKTFDAPTLMKAG